MPIDEPTNDDRSRLARVGLTGDDAFLTLKEACRECFNDSISPATLKVEAERGNLNIYKIGRAYFTTKRDIALMKEKCHVPVKPAQRTQKTIERDTAMRSQPARAALLLTIEKVKASQRASREQSDAPKRKRPYFRRRVPPAAPSE